MDQNPNQSHPERDQQNPLDASGQPIIPRQPPEGVPRQPEYGQPSWGVPQYPGPPVGGPPYPPYPPYPGYPTGAPPYPPYPGYPAGAPPYPPYPGYVPGPPPRKGSKLWLWVLLTIIGLSLVLCVTSCIFFTTAFIPSVNSSIKNAQATASAVATPDNGNSSFAAPNVKTVPIGQAVTITNLVCTLTTVRAISGDASVTPQAGDEFIAVNVKLTNHSHQSQTYDAFNFYVVNSAGKASLNSHAVPAAYKQQLSEGVLAPGQSVEGKLVYEVARSDHGQTLDWQPDLNASPQDANIGSWKLGL